MNMFLKSLSVVALCSVDVVALNMNPVEERRNVDVVAEAKKLKNDDDLAKLLKNDDEDAGPRFTDAALAHITDLYMEAKKEPHNTYNPPAPVGQEQMQIDKNPEKKGKEIRALITAGRVEDAQKELDAALAEKLLRDETVKELQELLEKRLSTFEFFIDDTQLWYQKKDEIHWGAVLKGKKEAKWLPQGTEQDCLNSQGELDTKVLLKVYKSEEFPDYIYVRNVWQKWKLEACYRESDKKKRPSIRFMQPEDFKFVIHSADLKDVTFHLTDVSDDKSESKTTYKFNFEAYNSDLSREDRRRVARRNRRRSQPCECDCDEHCQKHGGAYVTLVVCVIVVVAVAVLYGSWLYKDPEENWATTKEILCVIGFLLFWLCVWSAVGFAGCMTLLALTK